MKRLNLILVILLCTLSFTSCKSRPAIQRICKGEKVEIYLLNREQNYGRFGEHWADFKLEDFMLMDRPLLTSEDIESYKKNTMKLKKSFIIAKGTGLKDAYSYDTFKEGTLYFKHDNRTYEVKKSSKEFFYYDPYYDISVVCYGDTIFLVTQEKDEDYNNNQERTEKGEYKRSVIGLPYILVVNGIRKELGILKVSEGEFLIPGVFSSMSYAGMPEDLPVVVPKGDLLEFYVEDNIFW